MDILSSNHLLVLIYRIKYTQATSNDDQELSDIAEQRVGENRSEGPTRTNTPSNASLYGVGAPATVDNSA